MPHVAAMEDLDGSRVWVDVGCDCFFGGAAVQGDGQMRGIPKASFV
jgi:hypothetical protein